MTKYTRTQVMDEILFVLGNHHEGLTIKEISSSLKNSIITRSLQRYILAMKKEGLIYSQGTSRATRYYLATHRTTRAQISDHPSGYIPISSEGEEVRRYISQPLSKRNPVNYHSDFLFDYIPNKTYYLNTEMREHLHNIGKQPTPDIPGATFANKILKRLLIDLSWNSSRLEGNTYSLLETERLIDFNHAASGKDLLETRMILNHKAAIEFLVEQGQELSFNRYIILNLHALLANNLLGDPQAAGRLRTIPVGIGKTSYQPLTIPQLIEEYFSKILETCSAINDPFEQSFFALVHFPYLQAFIDVNKRVSRLASNIPLIKYNYCPISFIDVPTQAYIDGILGVYELNNVDLLADVFLWSYERSTLRYSEAQAYLIEPDIFNEKYDTLIKKIVREIILNKVNPEQAIKSIAIYSENQIPEKDQQKFIETVHTEILSLHEGNMAKFKINPKDFEAWKKIWNKSL